MKNGHVRPLVIGMVLTLVCSGVGLVGTDAAAATTSPADECPTDHPFPLVVEAEYAYELAYVGDITACTNWYSTSTWLSNGGDAVWTIRVVGGGSVVYRTHTDEAIARREAVGSVYAFAVLGPDNELVVKASPTATRFYPDAALSSLWWTHELLTSVIESELDDAIDDEIIDLASKRSPYRGVLATCAIGAYRGMESLKTLLDEDDDDAAEQFMEGIGLASSTSACAGAWAKLDDVPTWRRGIVSLSDNVGFLAKVSGWLDNVLTASKIILVNA